MTGRQLVEVSGLTFKHLDSKKELFHGVDLRIDAGDRILITGSSGAGKSTLLFLIAGYIPQWIPGRVGGTIERSTDNIAAVFQNPDSQMIAPTVAEEVAFGLENRTTPRADMHRKVDAILDRFGLRSYANRSPAELSGGERQKVALAGALVVQPQLLLLDEPTAYLDPLAAAEFFVLLAGLPLKTAVVMVEHKVDLAANFAQRVISVEENGSIVERSGAGGFDREAHLPWRLRRLVSVPAGTRRTDGSATDAPPPGPAGRTSPTSPAVRRNAPAIELQRVSYRYGTAAHALRDVNLSIRPGESVAVMGPNGAGKSTLIERVAGVLAGDEGRILFSNTDAAGMTRKDRYRRLLYLPQNPEHFFLRDLVSEELDLAAGRTRRASIEEAARSFRLETLLPQNPYSLSEGEKRRLNLACAFLDDRDILLLDEPTFGLDYSAFARLVESLRTLRDRGCTTLMVTHSPELAFLAADRIVVLDRGRVTYIGPPMQAAAAGAALLPAWERET